WQRRESLPVIYEAEMAADLIVPLQVQVPAQATLSFRTVVPGGVGLSHIKTAVNVVATSTVRTISPNSTHNGPRLSGILQEILRREEGFGGTLVFVSETAGCAFRLGQTVGGAGVGAEGDWGGDAPEVSDDEIRERKRRNLSAILRDNPETDLKPNELPVTASALTMQSPLTDVPFAVELIQRLQQQEGIAEETEAAHRWLQQYVEVALPGFLTLLSRYGIGLEGHQQNSIMVFHQGRPVRMIQRDFGGVRISRRRLEAQGLLPDLYPGSMTLVDDEDEMRGKLFHAVYQGQIGELILTLARHYGIDDRLFWRHVYTVSHRVFAELKQDPAIHDQAAEDETALFADKLSLKALTRMRLDLPCANRQYTLEKVPNPLVR
ncbi:MAG TPA: IucA/IucC family C-terminal-domain containing protein, partial [Bacilli bacterium]|nr:IucA/IucC family C-terminal-domain containing protein [Bacilli bacterium]